MREKVRARLEFARKVAVEAYGSLDRLADRLNTPLFLLLLIGIPFGGLTWAFGAAWGAAVVGVIFLGLLAEGAFSVWRQTDDQLKATLTEDQAPLSLRITSLREEGEAIVYRAENDDAWQFAHVQAAFQEWEGGVSNVLLHDLPEYVNWLKKEHGAEQPLRLGGLLADPAPTLRIRLLRLSEIEGVVLARQADGHPEGAAITSRFLLLDMIIRLIAQAEDYLSPNWFDGPLARAPVGDVNDALRRWNQSYEGIVGSAFPSEPEPAAGQEPPAEPREGINVPQVLSASVRQEHLLALATAFPSWQIPPNFDPYSFPECRGVV